MGPSWTKVRDGAREGTLRRSDPNLAAFVARWDDLVRYVALSLTAELGREVRQVLPSTERSPSTRRHALIDSLASSSAVYAELRIPDVAGTLDLSADLRARQVTASTVIDAPATGTSKGRVSWILRQLQQAPDPTVLEARTPGRGQNPVAPLHSVREDPSILYPERGEIRSFRVSLSANMGLKRDASRGSFVRSVTDLTEAFYGDVLQNIRAWKAPPPKLKRPTEEETLETVADIVGVERDKLGDEVPDNIGEARPDYVQPSPVRQTRSAPVDEGVPAESSETPPTPPE